MPARPATPVRRRPGEEQAQEAEPQGEMKSPWVNYAKAPLPKILVVLLALMILVPIELSLRAGTLFVPWYRLVLLLIAIPVVMRVVTRKVDLKLFDWCIIGHCLWIFAAEFLKRGGGAIQPGFVFLLESMVAYLAMRCFMVRPGQFASFAQTLFLMLSIAVILAIPEAMILKERYLHDMASAISGYYYRFQDDFRLNMLRAASLFEHPILFGLFCSCTFGLVWSTARTSAERGVKGAILLFGTFLSASSAPLLTAIIQIILMTSERATRHIKKRLKILVWGVVLIFTVLSIFSNRGPVGIIATSLALNPQSAYYRILIWEYTIDDVYRHPIIGFLPEQWTRPWWMSDSLDNHWLAQALRGGIPCVVLILVAYYLIWRALYKTKDVPAEYGRARFGWSIVALALVLGGATVAFFGKMQPFNFMLLGYGAALSQTLFSETISVPGKSAGPRRPKRPGAAARDKIENG